LLYFVGNWDVNQISLEDVYRTVVFCFQRMVSEIETQSNGVVIILDFQDFALHQIRHFTPSFVKKVANLVQVEHNNQILYSEQK
jgi:retinaldehyde-binding protein 1